MTAKIRSLPDPRREAIVKRELEGRSHEEIATSLGVSAGAVRGVIYRARTALRDRDGMLIPLRLVPASPSNTEAAGRPMSRQPRAARRPTHPTRTEWQLERAELCRFRRRSRHGNEP